MGVNSLACQLMQWPRLLKSRAGESDTVAAKRGVVGCVGFATAATPMLLPGCSNSEQACPRSRAARGLAEHETESPDSPCGILDHRRPDVGQQFFLCLLSTRSCRWPG